MTFIKELDSSGFIDRLYKSTAVAKVAPRAEPAATPAPAKEKAAPPESKVKAVGTVEEKVKPTAKQPPAATEKPAVPKVASTVKPAAEEYIIKQGDTLSKLAERFYNSMNKWPKIYEANRDSVKNPNYIFVGQKIVIPPDEQAR
ncbi:MAG: LysM peptidoglycan-binding domain-containing protein [Deltaproteobacteria bacterium]|nr:LysM peptidoglycan-binding domain-containing protein [Deltaproteobacteria bacterium]